MWWLKKEWIPENIGVYYFFAPKYDRCVIFLYSEFVDVKYCIYEYCTRITAVLTPWESIQNKTPVIISAIIAFMAGKKNATQFYCK